MIGKIILIVILILVVLFVVVGMAGFITLLLLAYGEDQDHENSVNVPRGTTMGTTRTTTYQEQVKSNFR